MAQLTTKGPWLTPGCTCPNCGSPPSVRITQDRRQRALLQDPDDVEISHQCSVSWCLTFYVLRAVDYATAE